jgi:hypothetical protein
LLNPKTKPPLLPEGDQNNENIKNILACFYTQFPAEASLCDRQAILERAVTIVTSQFDVVRPKERIAPLD